MTVTEPVEQTEESASDKLMEIPERYVPKYLSPSSASSYRECARRWKFRYVDRLPDPPERRRLLAPSPTWCWRS